MSAEPLNWLSVRAAKPETFNSVIVWGTLEMEDVPDSHEGYWSGREWWSVRSRDEDAAAHKLIHEVTHWMPRPPAPDAFQKTAEG